MIAHSKVAPVNTEALLAELRNAKNIGVARLLSKKSDCFKPASAEKLLFTSFPGLAATISRNAVPVGNLDEMEGELEFAFANNRTPVFFTTQRVSVEFDGNLNEVFHLIAQRANRNIFRIHAHLKNVLKSKVIYSLSVYTPGGEVHSLPPLREESN